MNIAEAQRYADFVTKITDVIHAESNQDGLSGCLVGIGIGGMIGHGATEEEVRAVFERALQSVLVARVQMAKESS